MAMREYLPEPSTIKHLEPEELGGYILAYLNTGEGQTQNIQCLTNFLGTYRSAYREAGADKDCALAISEAWQWLESNGLLCHNPEPSMGIWILVTRRGRRLKTRDQVAAYQRTNLLPASLLHPQLLGKVLPIFVRGDYDTAIFQAFKEVEVAVRKAGDFKRDAYGPEMMRAAFMPETGKLTDKAAAKKEQEGMRDLFAGAIAAYKGPGGHRHIEISDREAVEKVLLASHLLWIVDERQKAS
jgi:uncharacterized protein (TIGR02391 family)